MSESKSSKPEEESESSSSEDSIIMPGTLKKTSKSQTPGTSKSKSKAKKGTKKKTTPVKGGADSSKKKRNSPPKSKRKNKKSQEKAKQLGELWTKVMSEADDARFGDEVDGLKEVISKYRGKTTAEMKSLERESKLTYADVVRALAEEEDTIPLPSNSTVDNFANSFKKSFEDLPVLSKLNVLVGIYVPRDLYLRLWDTHNDVLKEDRGALGEFLDKCTVKVKGALCLFAEISGANQSRPEKLMLKLCRQASFYDVEPSKWPTGMILRAICVRSEMTNMGPDNNPDLPPSRKGMDSRTNASDDSKADMCPWVNVMKQVLNPNHETVCLKTALVNSFGRNWATEGKVKVQARSGRTGDPEKDRKDGYETDEGKDTIDDRDWAVKVVEETKVDYESAIPDLLKDDLPDKETLPDKKRKAVATKKWLQLAKSAETLFKVTLTEQHSIFDKDFHHSGGGNDYSYVQFCKNIKYFNPKVMLWMHLLVKIGDPWTFLSKQGQGSTSKALPVISSSEPVAKNVRSAPRYKRKIDGVASPATKEAKKQLIAAQTKFISAIAQGEKKKDEGDVALHRMGKLHRLAEFYDGLEKRIEALETKLLGLEDEEGNVLPGKEDLAQRTTKMINILKAQLAEALE